MKEETMKGLIKMTKIIKHLAVGGLTLTGLASINAVNADTFEDDVKKDKVSDQERMNAWRKETKNVMDENAQNEAKYRAEVKALGADKTRVDVEREYQNKKDRVKQENEVRKVVYEKEKKEVDERNRAKRAKYHEDYARYIQNRDHGATEPQIPTYESLPTLELLDEPQPPRLDDGGSFGLTRPEEKPLPHTPKLAFLNFPTETTVNEETPKTTEEPKGIEYESETTHKVNEEPKGIETETTLKTAEVQPEMALEMGNDSKSEIKEVEKTSSNVSDKVDKIKADIENKLDELKPKVETTKKEGEEALEKTSSNITDKINEVTSKVTDKKDDGKKETSETPNKMDESKKEVEKTKSHLNVDTNSSNLITVKYIDEKGSDIKASTTMAPSQATEPGTIDGYEYVTSKKDNDVIAHIFKKKGKEQKQATQTNEPKQETSQTNDSKHEQKSEDLANSNVAVYVTKDSAKNKQYYYMESTARAHNPTNEQITRTTEGNAVKQGFTWAGDKVEPNPQKTEFESKQHGATDGTSVNGNNTLPHTGDEGSLASLVGMGLLGMGALGVRRKKAK